MTTEPFKPEMFLVINARIPVEEKIEGEELYRQLREMLKNYSEKIMLFGQINETLEPCCKEKTKIPAAVGMPPTAIPQPKM